MAAADRRLLIDVDVNDQNATRKLADVERGVRGVESAAKGGAPALQEVDGRLAALAGSSGNAATAMSLLGRTVAVLGIGAVVKDFVDGASAIADMSAKTGIGTTELQRLKYAAEQTGGSIDQVSGAVTQMLNRLGEGNTGAVGALRTLGLNFNEIRSLDPGQMFEVIAERLRGVEDPAKQMALGMDLMGRSFGNVLPMIKGGVKELGDEAERLGLVLSEGAIKQGDELGDSWTTLTGVGKQLIAAVLVPFLPLFQLLADILGVVGVVLTPVIKGLTEASLLPWKFISDSIRLVADAWDVFTIATGKAIENPAVEKAPTYFNELSDAAMKAGDDLQNRLPGMMKEAMDASADLAKAMRDDAARAAEALARHLKGIRDELTGAGLIRSAREYVTETEKLGGAANLTADGQKKLNDALSKALPYFKEIPPEIDKMWRATNILNAEWLRLPNIVIPPLIDMHSRLLSMSSLDLSNIAGGNFQAAIDHTAAAFTRHAEQTRLAVAELNTYVGFWQGSVVPNVTSAIGSIGTALGDAIVNLTSWKDAGISILQQFRTGFANIISDIVNNVLGMLTRGLANVFGGGGSFGSAFSLGGLFGPGGFLGTGAAAGGMFGLPGVAGAAAAGPAIGAGGAVGGAGAAGGLSGLAATGIGAAIAGGIALAWGIVQKGLFRGGEEALHVNQPRDVFLQQTAAGLLAPGSVMANAPDAATFGTGGGTGAGSAFYTVANALTQATGQAGGGAAFAALLSADTVKEAEAAYAQINTILGQWMAKQQEVAQATEDAAAATEGAAASTAATATDAAAAATAAQQALDNQVTVIQSTLDDLNQQKDALVQSIANEAPEQVMGVVEQQTRDQIALLDEQAKAVQVQLQTAQQAAADNADIQTRIIADTSTTAMQTADTTATTVSDDIIRVTDGAALGFQGITDEIVEMGNTALGSHGIIPQIVQGLKDIEAAAGGAAHGHSPTGIKEIPLQFQSAAAEAAYFGRVAMGVLGDVEMKAAQTLRPWWEREDFPRGWRELPDREQQAMLARAEKDWLLDHPANIASDLRPGAIGGHGETGSEQQAAWANEDVAGLFPTLAAVQTELRRQREGGGGTTTAYFAKLEQWRDELMYGPGGKEGDSRRPVYNVTINAQGAFMQDAASQARLARMVSDEIGKQAQNTRRLAR